MQMGSSTLPLIPSASVTKFSVKLNILTLLSYLIAILSNQGGISLRKDSKTAKGDLKRLSDFKAKVAAVLSQLELPISLYAATGKDWFRKPRTGMWDELLEDHDLDAVGSVDLENSFFVGDAGGRAGSSTGGAGKDHSCSDRSANTTKRISLRIFTDFSRNFAANVGIPFMTPEEYFLHEEPKPFTRDFNPADFLNSTGLTSTDASEFIGLLLPASTNLIDILLHHLAPIVFTKNNLVDIVLFCGSPGVGKSTFYWSHLKPLGYERVNQDILKTVRVI